MPYVEVEVDLNEFSDEELLQELERRQIELDDNSAAEFKDLVEKIYLKRIFGLDFVKEVDHLIYAVLGRIL